MSAPVEPSNETEGPSSTSSSLVFLARQAANDAEQVAFRVFKPRPLASIRRSSNAVLRPRLGGVVVLELHAATPHLFDGSARFGDLDDGLREFPRRPRLGWIDKELVDTISNR